MQRAWRAGRDKVTPLRGQTEDFFRPQVGAGSSEPTMLRWIIICQAARHLDICFELWWPERTPPRQVAERVIIWSVNRASGLSSITGAVWISVHFSQCLLHCWRLLFYMRLCFKGLLQRFTWETPCPTSATHSSFESLLSFRLHLFCQSLFLPWFCCSGVTIIQTIKLPRRFLFLIFFFWCTFCFLFLIVF